MFKKALIPILMMGTASSEFQLFGDKVKNLLKHKMDDIDEEVAEKKQEKIDTMPVGLEIDIDLMYDTNYLFQAPGNSKVTV